ncbi:MAG: ATP-binding cassette domain-containing protein [Oscillospiraceae bacterium]|jgi:zinc transport system ATP-binding protein|nr:ATP-binding cassette domain-containing protein [Oscillospiraceae bacterium]
MMNNERNKEPLLTCQSLCLAYENREIIHELSFALRPGECLCVVGENGTGKSTLLKALLGLKKPSEGRIVFGGGLTQRGIGYLPQQTPVQKDFPAAVGEVVRSGLLHETGVRPWYTKAQRCRARERMDQMGIAGLEKRCFRELSGGQQQRVLLARALCATQQLLLLDEPAAGLDPLAARELSHIIAELHREQGIAVILVTHDVHSVLAQADLVLHLAVGGERFLGALADYPAHPLGQTFLASDPCGENSRSEPEQDNISNGKAGAGI